LTVTELIIIGSIAIILAVPLCPGFWIDVAVITATPAAVGVKIPWGVIVPLVADHVTFGLIGPNPPTEAEQVAVVVLRIDAELHDTVTDVT
jgi:hypothetical protein